MHHYRRGSGARPKRAARRRNSSIAKAPFTRQRREMFACPNNGERNAWRVRDDWGRKGIARAGAAEAPRRGWNGDEVVVSGPPAKDAHGGVGLPVGGGGGKVDRQQRAKQRRTEALAWDCQQGPDDVNKRRADSQHHEPHRTSWSTAPAFNDAERNAAGRHGWKAGTISSKSSANGV